MKFIKKSLPLAVCAISALLSFAAHAETWTVTSNADSGDGTLRALVGSAADGDVIAIPEGMTIALEAVIALPNASLEVVGLGKGATIRGAGTHRLFSYSGSGRKVPRRIAFSKLTISDGNDGGAGGGAFFIERLNEGFELELVCTDCTFTGHRASQSNSMGAVFGHSAGTKDYKSALVPFSLYCTNCVFSGNAGGSAIAGSAGNFGHFARNVVFSGCDFHDNGLGTLSEEERDVAIYKYGLFNGPASSFLIDNCVFTNNSFSATQNVGALYRNQVTNPDASFTMVDCLIADNTYDVELFNLVAGTNTFRRCRFLRNIDQGISNAGNVIGSFVGGVSHHIRFEDSLFEDNEANAAAPAGNVSYLFGGLFYVGLQVADASFIVERCAFRRNTAKNIATSILVCYQDKEYACRFTDCAFESNKSGCGRLMTLKGNSSMTRCSVIGNTRVDAELTTQNWADKVMIEMVRGGYYDCTFYGNVQDGNRGIIDAGAPVIRGCTIVNNRTKASYGAIASVKSAADIRNTICNGNFSVNGETVAALDIGLGGAKGDPIPENVRCVAASKGTWQDASLSAWNNDENLIGKSNEELGLILPPAANGSKIKLLDGTSPLTIALAHNSPLRKAGKAFADYPLPFDGRGKKRNALAPCIGAYEYIAPGLSLIVR